MMDTGKSTTGRERAEGRHVVVIHVRFIQRTFTLCLMVGLIRYQAGKRTGCKTGHDDVLKDREATQTGEG